MRQARDITQEIRWMGALRRGLEYAVALGLAILSSYWIMRGRW
jgi:hypothetical protein